MIAQRFGRCDASTYGNEEVGHASLILEPGVAVLEAAAVDITRGAVGNHAQEEDRVEPGEGAVEAGNETPRDGEPSIGGVVNLAGEAVPAVDENGSLLRLDGPGVPDSLPRDLGEGLAPDNLAALHGAEAVLLAVAAVPDPVPEEVGEVEDDEREAVPAILGRVVVGQEDGAVAVREGHAGQVPEDEHETPLLVVHVPGGDDELLALGAGVGVQVVGHDEEENLTRDVAVLLVLASGGSQAENQEEVPGHADLEEHLEVEDAKHAGVQLGTHEEVVDEVAGHAVLLTAPEGGEVGDEADKEAAADGDGQERAKLVNGRVQGPDAGKVQDGQAGHGKVQGQVGVAVVRQLLAALVRERLTVAPDAGKEAVTGTLEDEIRPVPEPRLGVRECAGVDKAGEVLGKLSPGHAGGARRELAIVVRGTNPHVPHENGEEGHHEKGADRATKLSLARVVNLGVLAGPPAVDDADLDIVRLFGAGLSGGARLGGRALAVAIGGSLGGFHLGLGDWFLWGILELGGGSATDRTSARGLVRHRGRVGLGI